MVERVKRELAYTGTILKVYKDYVIANGHKAEWDFINHDGAAAVIPVLDDGKILMVKQYRNALDRYTLELPAGKVDSVGEEKRLCAFRELEEETGMKVDSPKDLEYLLTVDTTVAFCNEEIEIFVARNLKKTTQDLDEDEEVEVEAWELGKLIEKIYKGELKDSKTVSGLLAYASKYGNRK